MNNQRDNRGKKRIAVDERQGKINELKLCMCLVQIIFTSPHGEHFMGFRLIYDNS